MKLKRMNVMMIAGAAFVLSAGLIGSNFVSKAQPDEFTVLESGTIKENEPQVVNLSNTTEVKGIQEVDISKIPQRVDGESEIQYANSKTEEEWTALASEALDKYFDVDVSNLKSMFYASPAIDKYGIKESASVLFSENPDDISSSTFYNVVFDPKSGTVQEVYDVFSDVAGGKKVVAASVTVDEAKKMAEEFIIDKELANADNMEYIGGKATCEGRIHVAFKIGDDISISVGIDTYTNEIKSFFIRDIESAEVMIFSTLEDAVG